MRVHLLARSAFLFEHTGGINRFNHIAFIVVSFVMGAAANVRTRSKPAQWDVYILEDFEELVKNVHDAYHLHLFGLSALWQMVSFRWQFAH